jgi:phenylacetate-CoA ligase
MASSDLLRYQIHRLGRVIAYARRNSPFYRERLGGLPDHFLYTVEDLAEVPFTEESDLKNHHLGMLCVSQSDVSRIVTVQGPDPTPAPKRLYFTDDDLELTMDFFHHGMRTLARPEDRVLILMPGETPGSIGDLLKKSLARLNVEGIIYGPVTDPDHCIETLLKVQACCLVGIPVQVLGLVRHPRSRDIPSGLIRSILLSADYVPKTIVDELEDRLKAPVFEHYGTIEMGLGGGVQCNVREGYHLREADLFFEIIDPLKGIQVADGDEGEVVFTTLTRQGMPLIRYRTGDLARFLPEPCPCGSSLRRLGKIRGRVAGRVQLNEGDVLTIPEMDEVLFKVPGLLDYRAELSCWKGKDCLSIEVHAVPGTVPERLREVASSLMTIPSVQKAATQGRLLLGPNCFSLSGWPTTGTIKRMLLDRRHKRV